MTSPKAGGSDYAYDLLKRAGVDLPTPDTYRATVDRMNMIMDRIEAILDAREKAGQAHWRGREKIAVASEKQGLSPPLFFARVNPPLRDYWDNRRPVAPFRSAGDGQP